MVLEIKTSSLIWIFNQAEISSHAQVYIMLPIILSCPVFLSFFPCYLCSFFSFFLILQLRIRGYTRDQQWRELSESMSKMQQDVRHWSQIYHFVPSLTRQLVPYVHRWRSNRRGHFQSFQSLSQLLQLVQEVKFKSWPFPHATSTSMFQNFLPEGGENAKKKFLLAKSRVGQ